MLSLFVSSEWPDRLLYKSAVSAGNLDSRVQRLVRTYLKRRKVRMSSDLQRQDSLRTVLRNQKRRLSATEKKPVTTEFGPGVNKSVLGGLKTRDSLTPPRRDLLTPPRATPPR